MDLTNNCQNCSKVPSFFVNLCTNAKKKLVGSLNCLADVRKLGGEKEGDADEEAKVEEEEGIEEKESQ